MAIVYASFGILRTEWLSYIHPLNLQRASFVQHFAKKPLCASTYGA
jgi:hypothetical protein